MSPHCAKANWFEFQWEFNQCQDIVIQRLVKMTAGGSRVWSPSSATCRTKFLHFFCNFFGLNKKNFYSTSLSYNCTSNPRKNNSAFACCFKMWRHFPMIVNQWRVRVNLCLWSSLRTKNYLWTDCFTVHSKCAREPRLCIITYMQKKKERKTKSAFL